MNRRSFLQIGSALPALTTTCSRLPERPNILWIFAEDFSPDLGCYGNELVSTPNLDQLAAEGVRYTNAICTAAVCSAARSALMTGMFQTSIGAHNHRSHRDHEYVLPDGVQTVTALLRAAGYHTSNCRNPAPGVEVRGKTDFNFKLEKPFDGADWSERPAGAPFYSQVNFSETHRQFQRFEHAPVDPASIHLAPYYPDHPVVREDIALYLDTAQHLDVKVGKVIQRLKDESLYESTIIFFFGDHGQALHRGKQWLYEQGIRIPLIVRIPDAYCPADFAPGTVDDRLLQHIDIAATTLDLAGASRPKGMQARVFLGANADPEPEFAFSARDRCDETVDRIRCVRTKRWKLIRNFLPDRSYAQKNHYKDTSYPALQVMRQLKERGKLSGPPARWLAPTRPEFELYDLAADPHEVENLAGDPRHAATLAQLRSVLDSWVEDSNDLGPEFESALPAEYSFRTMVDGWYTSNGLLSKARNTLLLDWRGRERGNREVFVPIVAQGGELRLDMEMRSIQAQEVELRWGTPARARSAGLREIDLKPGSTWRKLSVDIDADGWLTLFSLRFSNPSSVECRRASLARRDGSRVVRTWNFA